MAKLLILSLLSMSLFAASVEITVNPQDPVIDETFNITFLVESTSGAIPEIEFDSQNLEILSKEQTGSSTSTTYINGNLSVSRKVTISYEATGKQPGFAYLTNIQVRVNDEVEKLPSKRINIVKGARRARNVFARAEVDKQEVYVNESIVLRYYLYSKPRVLSLDVKKFPSLSKFLKRFHQEASTAERVQLGNEIYERRVIYTAQLFPQEAGEFSVDPISLNVTYGDSSRSNPFSNFGFGSMRPRKISVKSTPVSIKVKELPMLPPPNYTQLVGDHDVSFKINKSKFLINEPIEIDFRISGEGALEIFEAPSLFRSDLVEEFDSSSDFVINKDFTAQKSFKITYLPREAGVIPAKEKVLEIFDPKTKQMVKKTLSIPSLVIAGTAAANTGSRQSGVPSVPTKEKAQAAPEASYELTPIFSLKNTIVYHWTSIILFILFILLTYLSWYLFKVFGHAYQRSSLDIYQEAAKKGADYGVFYEIIQRMNRGSSLKECIQRSNLASKDKERLQEFLAKFNQAYEKGQRIKLKLDKTLISKIKKESLES